jgi:hypothetical protein
MHTLCFVVASFLYIRFKTTTKFGSIFGSTISAETRLRLNIELLSLREEKPVSASWPSNSAHLPLLEGWKKKNHCYLVKKKLIRQGEYFQN